MPRSLLLLALLAPRPQEPAASTSAPAPASRPATSSGPQGAASAPAVQRFERVLDLAIDDAVRRALAFNPNLASASLNVEALRAQIDAAKGAFEPVAFANPLVRDSHTPTANQLAGATDLESNTLHLDTGIRQTLPTGGSYALTYQADNTRTNNQFSTLNPQTFANFGVVFTQPLLRTAWTGYGEIPTMEAEAARDSAAAARDLTQMDTIQQVYNAYWDLVFAIVDRDVKRSSLQLAEQLLEINRKKVDEGVSAEVDIYQAAADVATRRQALLLAENLIRAGEDALKQLLFPFETSSEWTFRIRPTSAPPARGSVLIPSWEEALSVAYERRPDLVQQRLALKQTELVLEARRSEELPLVNFQASGTSAGLAARADQTTRDIVAGDFLSYTVGLAIEVPLGNLAARSRRLSAEVLVSVERQKLRALETQVARDVRDAVRQVAFGEENIAAAARSREFAEKQLNAEQLRFEQGLSTNFEVLSLQRDLAQAQTSEQLAILQYARAAIALERAKGTLAPPSAPKP